MINGVIMDKASLQACMDWRVMWSILYLRCPLTVPWVPPLPLVASSALSGSRPSWDPQTQKSWGVGDIWLVLAEEDTHTSENRAPLPDS